MIRTYEVKLPTGKVTIEVDCNPVPDFAAMERDWIAKGYGVRRMVRVPGTLGHTKWIAVRKPRQSSAKKSSGTAKSSPVSR